MFLMIESSTNAETAPAETPSKGCARCGDDAAGERAARRLAMADELAAMGMDVARALRKQIVDEAAGKPADPAAPRGERDPGLTFTRVARMVSHLLSLADRLDRGVEARAEAVREKALRGPRPRTPGEDRRDEIIQIVEAILEPEIADDATLDNMVLEACDRVDGYGERHLMKHPIGVIIAQLFEDLNVTPDWSRWKDEAWAVELMAMGDDDDAEAQAP
jgi:hypothetical protein